LSNKNDGDDDVQSLLSRIKAIAVYKNSCYLVTFDIR